MITEDYVSEKTAELLKEKGFNEECWCLYHLVEHKFAREVCFDLRHNNELPNYIASAPTLQMAMKWLRINHDIDIIPFHERLPKDCYWCRIEKYPYTEHQQEPIYKTQEEACDAAIKYCLEHKIWD